VNGNQGWMDYPWVSSGADDGEGKTATTDPALGFDKIIRCSYWINSNNPVSGTPPSSNAFLTPLKDCYYTTTPGYGMSSYGFLKLHKTTDVVNSSEVITLADGVYGGRQSSSRQTYALYATTMTNRVAYRHPGISGNNSASNVCFADGHVEHFGYTNFPTPVGAKEYNSTSVVYTHNENEAVLNGPTVYTNATLFAPPN
jgi:prepilin-type processing-associated H-X9-DG protein